MTVGTKLHQALSSLEGLKADMDSFAFETEDKSAKADFMRFSQQLESVKKGLEQRINAIEQMEPQYKVRQQIQNQAQQNKQQ
ncbi:MAG: hypothetical protein XD50_1662 [Clostridia bacterium 41_269]|nr:MAG: hypothetical protein XD50_1662 [Clostridia bacterium 41_269]